MQATIHGAQDPHGSVPWPDTAEAQMLRTWIEPFWREGTAAFIPNVHSEMYIAVCGKIVLPLSVGQAHGDSYVVSPFAHYISYAVDETRHFGWLSQLAARIIAWPAGLFCRATQLDNVVMVNNWLLSTNLYPEIDRDSVLAILEKVRERWPSRAVVFRSVDLGLRQELHDWLKAADARMVFSRRIHIVREAKAVLRRSDNRKDAKLAATSVHQATTENDVERIAQLYGQLYLAKYSGFNPVFTPRLIGHAASSGVLELQSWRDTNTGDTELVIGTWTFNRVLTTPLLGYNTERPRKDGLYRIACRAILDRAHERGIVAHRSAGAATFKQARGADSFLEYNAVFDRHLPWWRRLPWQVLRGLLERLVVPMMLRRNL